MDGLWPRATSVFAESHIFTATQLIENTRSAPKSPSKTVDTHATFESRTNAMRQAPFNKIHHNSSNMAPFFDNESIARQPSQKSPQPQPVENSAQHER